MPRCSECGFLGLRNGTTGAIDETHEKYLCGGSASLAVGVGMANYVTPPICEKDSRDLTTPIQHKR